MYFAKLRSSVDGQFSKERVGALLGVDRERAMLKRARQLLKSSKWVTCCPCKPNQDRTQRGSSTVVTQTQSVPSVRTMGTYTVDVAGAGTLRIRLGEGLWQTTGMAVVPSMRLRLRVWCSSVSASCRKAAMPQTRCR